MMHTPVPAPAIIYPSDRKLFVDYNTDVTSPDMFTDVKTNNVITVSNNLYGLYFKFGDCDKNRRISNPCKSYYKARANTMSTNYIAPLSLSL